MDHIVRSLWDVHKLLYMDEREEWDMTRGRDGIRCTCMCAYQKATLDHARGDENNITSYAVGRGSPAYTYQYQELMISYHSHDQAHLIPQGWLCTHDQSHHGTMPDVACAVAIRFLEDFHVLSQGVYYSQGSRRVLREFHASVCVRAMLLTKQQ